MDLDQHVRETKCISAIEKQSPQEFEAWFQNLRKQKQQEYLDLNQHVKTIKPSSSFKKNLVLFILLAYRVGEFKSQYSEQNQHSDGSGKYALQCLPQSNYDNFKCTNLEKLFTGSSENFCKIPTKTKNSENDTCKSIDNPTPYYIKQFANGIICEEALYNKLVRDGAEIGLSPQEYFNQLPLTDIDKNGQEKLGLINLFLNKYKNKDLQNYYQQLQENKNPKISAVHGANSGVFIGLSNTEIKALYPSGSLIKLGIVPFSGELREGATSNGVNRNSLSAYAAAEFQKSLKSYASQFHVNEEKAEVVERFIKSKRRIRPSAKQDFWLN